MRIIFPIFGSIHTNDALIMTLNKESHQVRASVVYTGFRGWGSREQWGWVLFDIGEIKNFPFVQTRKF